MKLTIHWEPTEFELDQTLSDYTSSFGEDSDEHGALNSINQDMDQDPVSFLEAFGPDKIQSVEVIHE